MDQQIGEAHVVLIEQESAPTRKFRYTLSYMRTHIVPVRLNDAELTALKERAEREGRTLSNLIRTSLFRPVKVATDSVGQVVVRDKT